jgi:hypothetical protein
MFFKLWEDLKFFLAGRGFELINKGGVIILKFGKEEIGKWNNTPSIEEVLERAEKYLREKQKEPTRR